MFCVLCDLCAFVVHGVCVCVRVHGARGVCGACGGVLVCVLIIPHFQETITTFLLTST